VPACRTDGHNADAQLPRAVGLLLDAAPPDVRFSFARMTAVDGRQQSAHQKNRAEMLSGGASGWLPGQARRAVFRYRVEKEDIQVGRVREGCGCGCGRGRGCGGGQLTPHPPARLPPCSHHARACQSALRARAYLHTAAFADSLARALSASGNSTITSGGGGGGGGGGSFHWPAAAGDLQTGRTRFKQVNVTYRGGQRLERKGRQGRQGLLGREGQRAPAAAVAAAGRAAREETAARADTAAAAAAVAAAHTGGAAGNGGAALALPSWLTALARRKRALHAAFAAGAVVLLYAVMTAALEHMRRQHARERDGCCATDTAMTGVGGGHSARGEGGGGGSSGSAAEKVPLRTLAPRAQSTRSYTYVGGAGLNFTQHVPAAAGGGGGGGAGGDAGGAGSNPAGDRAESDEDESEDDGADAALQLIMQARSEMARS
jgi:hypothetical protein